MKVLHVAETIKGGIANNLRDTLTIQSELDTSMRICALMPDDQKHLLRDVPLKMYGYDRTGRNLQSFMRLFAAIRRTVAVEEPDIVFLRSSIAGAVGRLALLSSPRRPRVVYCAHGWAFTREASFASNLFFGLLEAALSRINTDRIVNISRSEAIAAKNAWLPTSKMVTIYNGVRHVITPKASDKAKRGPIRLLYVGRFDHQKGIDRLIKAYCKLSPAKYHLTLIGEAVLKDDASITIPSTVTVISWQARDALFDQYRKADVLIVPSRWEGFGLVAAEAMQAGTAVIAARVGGLAEIVIDKLTGRLFDTDAELLRILKTATKRNLHLMGRKGRERYLSHFDARRTAESLLDVFRTLTEQHHYPH